MEREETTSLLKSLKPNSGGERKFLWFLATVVLIIFLYGIYKIILNFPNVLNLPLSALLTLLTGLCLWYCKEHFVDKKLKKNAISELSYAKLKLSGWINLVENPSRRIIGEQINSEIYTFSIRLLWKKGLLYSKLNNEQLENLSIVLEDLTIDYQSAINDALQNMDQRVGGVIARHVEFHGTRQQLLTHLKSTEKRLVKAITELKELSN